ncbi:MAG: hypothetical protein HC923_06450 [Myxococcales bacterium]|nr:hypothetical protein [Myxococcales bacterium]
MMKEHHLEDAILLSYAGGHLDDAAREGVLSHLSRCEACRARLAEIQRVVEALPTAVAEPPSVGFDVRLRARLDEIDRDAEAPSWSRWLSVGAPVAAACAIAAIRHREGLELRPGVRALPERATIEVPADLDLLADLELLEDLEALEILDVVEDLDAIRALPEEG